MFTDGLWRQMRHGEATKGVFHTRVDCQSTPAVNLLEEMQKSPLIFGYKLGTN